MLKKSLQIKAEKLAVDHWNYINGLYKILGIKSEKQIMELAFHYKTAFMHGFKHGIQSMKEKKKEGEEE